MARKAEPGISYFPLNTDITSSNKVKLVVSEFGPKTWAVITPLFCKIYREKGYYIDWSDEDLKLLFAQDECKCDLSFVKEVVTRLIKRGVFSEPVFSKFGILTSDRIQDNYLEAKSRSKNVSIWKDFTLINQSVYINAQFVDGNPKNVNTSTQSKVKKRKVNESKEFTAPSVSEVREYFKEKGYSEFEGEKAWNYYNASTWKDRDGNQVLNWKQKMISVWFKEESKSKVSAREPMSGGEKW